jgi:hypothetical protein
MLSNFQLGSHPLLQTLLLGQPEFREKLREHAGLEQLRQRVIASHHLEAMEAGEVQPYVEHRLTRVGWTGNPAFGDDVFAALHEASGGVPRRVNQILNRLLLLGAVERLGRIDRAMLSQVLDELRADGASAQPAPVAAPAAPQRLPDAPAPVAVMPADANWATQDQIQQAFIERDAQISELQQALIELANTVEGPLASANASHAQEASQLRDQVAALESRLAEQERTIRHTLTMLIEWIEADDVQRVAA